MKKETHLKLKLLMFNGQEAKNNRYAVEIIVTVLDFNMCDLCCVFDAQAYRSEI